MIWSWRGLAYAILAVMCISGVRYYFKVQKEHQEVDYLINAKFAAGITVPLDCTPLGKLPVSFDGEYSSPNTDEETIPQIVRDWPSLWPRIYAAVSIKAADYNAQENLRKLDKVMVVLPAASITANSDWSVDCGDFSAEMAGEQVKSTSAY